MKKTIFCTLFLLVVFTIGGCSRRLGDFTVLSTKNVDLSDFSTHTETSTELVKAEDVGHIIIVFPNKIPNFKEAIDKALEKSNSYLLTDAVLKEEWFYVPYIYGQDKFVAEGHPVYRVEQ